MQASVVKKRATNLYFFTSGQIAAYKILTGGFCHSAIVEMIVAELSQVRIWETVMLTC